MEQFKTMEDLREYVKGLGKFYARPTISGEHPTLYLDHSQGHMVQGIRVKDYLFSPCKQWVIPHDQMGLSFSAHWQHLKDKYRMKTKHADGKAVNVYWVLEAADIPAGLAFIQDKREKQHYLLTVTEQMTVYALAKKLAWVADRMSKITDAGKAL
ncbi:MAG TPA: hypothetical protein VL987_03670 [Cellvibrio sp.]|nr:hypothetical protein [Cellvibrio sp.]